MNFVPISYRLFSQVAPFDRNKHLRQILSLANFPFSTWPLHFCHYSIWTFSSAVHQCANEHFPQIDNHSRSCRTSILEVPLFTKWVIAISSKVILRPSRHSTTGTPASGTSGPRWFSLILPHARIRRRIWWWTFTTLIDIVAETAIVSFHTLPIGFPLPNSEQVGIIFDRIMGSSDPEVLVDHVIDLSSANAKVLPSFEAILASGTSAFEFLFTEHEDLRSFSESTNSTSLIHNNAFVGNCEQMQTLVLKLIFQTSIGAGVRNLSKWCIRSWSPP